MVAQSLTFASQSSSLQVFGDMIRLEPERIDELPEVLLGMEIFLVSSGGLGGASFWRGSVLKYDLKVTIHLTTC